MRESKRFVKGKALAVNALLLLLSVTLLTACGNTQASEDDTDNGTKNEETTETEEDEEVKKEDLPTAEEIEEEDGGNIEHPLRDLIDVTEKVAVKEVVDGDTIIVEGKNGEETVELALVETPEKNLPDGTPDEWFGFSSNRFTKTAMEGRTEVLLERAEPSKNDEGNTVGYFWMRNNSDHSSLNEVLLLKGLARLDESGSNTKYLDELREAEAEAKAEQKKIWSIDGYVTEDGFDSSLVQ